MTTLTHRLYILLLSVLILLTLVYLSYSGIGYYQTSLEERFFHADHMQLKPSGLIGHGLGIIGTLFILLGVAGYMARKRYRIMHRWGLIKHWLEFHIFLCTLGPIMVLFHTAFKFGGLVSISFWSMVAVFLSGIAGRFIYLQIPRTIEGRELSLNEVKNMRDEGSFGKRVSKEIGENIQLQISALMETATSSTRGKGFIRAFLGDRKYLRQLDQIMKENRIARPVRKRARRLAASELSLHHRISRLQKMQKLFTYWHVAHMPFALVMLVIMVIHVAITILFGFKWIF